MQVGKAERLMSWTMCERDGEREDHHCAPTHSSTATYSCSAVAMDTVPSLLSLGGLVTSARLTQADFSERAWAQKKEGDKVCIKDKERKGGVGDAEQLQDKRLRVSPCERRVD
ncbi:hypothetical protein NQZ68_002857 [Dissostichus eleginoides]|nr:hypothetical protein NQZ68_002857 [Dissostichus eleginoides]